MPHISSFHQAVPSSLARLVTTRRSERKGIQVTQVARLKAHFLAHRKILSKEFLTEATKDAPHAAPLHDDVIPNHNVVNSPINSGNGKVNLQAPHINTL